MCTCTFRHLGHTYVCRRVRGKTGWVSAPTNLVGIPQRKHFGPSREKPTAAAVRELLRRGLLAEGFRRAGYFANGAAWREQREIDNALAQVVARRALRKAPQWAMRHARRRLAFTSPADAHREATRIPRARPPSSEQARAGL
jgi:hypothetical protein